MKKKIFGSLISFVMICSLILFAAPIQADNLPAESLEDGGCFAIAVGREASADGSVFFAHNEDCGGVEVNRQEVIPRIYHEPGEVIVMEDTGLVIPQVEGETWATLRSWGADPAWPRNCDHYLNEWGVGIGSNGQGSKEQRPYDLTDGGLRFWARRLVAQRATTAREGVQIIGEMVETYGYAHSGRVYTIVDPNEVWLCAVVAGRHWVAQRVPDDEVAAYSNRYPIREVDLDDTDHFMACPDLIEYAIEKGWYDPESGEPFDFGKAYGSPSRQNSRSNLLRQWEGLRRVSGVSYPLDDLPFSVKPNRKFTLEDIRYVMASHYEGTEYDQTLDGDPHHDQSERPICTSSNQNCIIIQGRGWLPPFVGSIYWRTQGRPCEGVFVPWYSGVLEVPEQYYVGEPSSYNAPLEERYYDPNSAYWVFNRMNALVDLDYLNRAEVVRDVFDHMEAKAYARQDNIEKTALTLYEIDEQRGRRFLTIYTKNLALKAFFIARKFVDRWQE